MRLVRHLRDIPADVLATGSVVTIGAYDGLHLGHQQLLAETRERAKKLGVPSIVMSFEPTPKEFFQADEPPARLMRFREKFEALASNGIDIFYCPRFSSEVGRISAVDFVRRILVHGLQVRGLVVGDDFRFARRREGDIALLSTLGKTLGFDVLQVPSVMVNNIRVSSTAVREACDRGDMPLATALLGRHYRMSGKVVQGERVGRELGFPTANVDLRRRRSPLQGIYAVRVSGLASGPLDGVASVGSRPTFDGQKAILEVFLFDFDDDIYGDYIHVDFVAFLRPQEKYAVVDDLVAQMRLDADNARSVLAADPA